MIEYVVGVVRWTVEHSNSWWDRLRQCGWYYCTYSDDTVWEVGLLKDFFKFDDGYDIIWLCTVCMVYTVRVLENGFRVWVEWVLMIKISVSLMNPSLSGLKLVWMLLNSELEPHLTTIQSNPIHSTQPTLTPLIRLHWFSSFWFNKFSFLLLVLFFFSFFHFWFTLQSNFSISLSSSTSTSCASPTFTSPFTTKPPSVSPALSMIVEVRF